MRWRTFGIAAGVIGVVVVGGFAAMSVWVNSTADDSTRDDQAKLNAMLRRHEKQFRADERRLSAEPLFQPRNAAHPRDAGPVLAPFFPVVGAPAQGKPLLMPQAVADALKGGRIATFASKIGTVDVGALDLKWMSALTDYDVWDLESTPEMQRARPLLVRQLPLPSVGVASLWVQARLLRGFADGDLESAGRDVENLERLLFTAEAWPFDITGASLIDWERAAFVEAKARGLAVGAWAPLDEVSLAALHRVILAMNEYARPDGDPTIAGDLFTSSDARVARCGAVGHIAAVFIGLEPLARDLLVAEHARVGSELAATSSICRLKRVREAWENPAQTSIVTGIDAVCDAEHENCPSYSVALTMPPARKITIEMFEQAWLSFDPVSVFSKYEVLRGTGAR